MEGVSTSYPTCFNICQHVWSTSAYFAATKQRSGNYIISSVLANYLWLQLNILNKSNCFNSFLFPASKGHRSIMVCCLKTTYMVWWVNEWVGFLRLFQQLRLYRVDEMMWWWWWWTTMLPGHHALLFSKSDKGSFMCIMGRAHTTCHCRYLCLGSLINQLWATGWEKRIATHS